MKAGEKKELIYSTVTGIKSDLSGTQQKPDILDDSSGDDSDEGSSNGQSDDNGETDKKKFVSTARPRDESPNSKKVFKWLNVYY